GVGDVEPPEIVHIEAWFGADAGADRAPLADRAAAGVLRDRADGRLDAVVASVEAAAGGRGLVDRADGAAKRLVLLEAGGHRVVGGEAALEQVDVAGNVHAEAAAEAGHIADRDRHLIPAALGLLLAGVVHQLALGIVDADVALVGAVGCIDSTLGVHVETAD